MCVIARERVNAFWNTHDRVYRLVSVMFLLHFIHLFNEKQDRRLDLTWGYKKVDTAVGNFVKE